MLAAGKLARLAAWLSGWQLFAGCLLFAAYIVCWLAAGWWISVGGPPHAAETFSCWALRDLIIFPTVSF